MKKKTLTYRISNLRSPAEDYEVSIPSFASLFKIKDLPNDHHKIERKLSFDSEWIPEGKNSSYLHYSLLFQETKLYHFDVTVYVPDLNYMEIWIEYGKSWKSNVEYRSDSIKLTKHYSVKIQNPDKYKGLFRLREHHNVFDDLLFYKATIQQLMKDHYDMIMNKYKNFKELFETVKERCDCSENQTQFCV